MRSPGSRARSTEVRAKDFASGPAMAPRFQRQLAADVLEEEERDWYAEVTSAPGSPASGSASPTSPPTSCPISEGAQSPLRWPRMNLTGPQAIRLASALVIRCRRAAEHLRAIDKEQAKLRRRAKTRQRLVLAALTAMQVGWWEARVRRVVSLAVGSWRCSTGYGYFHRGEEQTFYENFRMRRREFNTLISFVGAEGGICEAPGPAAQRGRGRVSRVYTPV